MGCEFAQGNEWNHDQPLDWFVLEYPHHQGIKKLVTDLNALYKQHSALHHYDFDFDGFEWLDCNDIDQSVLSYLRKNEHETLYVILNFTPVPRKDYRIGVNDAGSYEEIFNSDSGYYHGSNMGNGNSLNTENLSWMGRPHSLNITLPPLGAVIIRKV